MQEREEKHRKEVDVLRAELNKHRADRYCTHDCGRVTFFDRVCMRRCRSEIITVVSNSAREHAVSERTTEMLNLKLEHARVECDRYAKYAFDLKAQLRQAQKVGYYAGNCI